MMNVCLKLSQSVKSRCGRGLGEVEVKAQKAEKSA
jgi:hypothetical protein